MGSELHNTHGFEPSIKWSGRSILGPFDWICMLIFWVGLFGQLIVGFVIIGEKNASSPVFDVDIVNKHLATCPDGYYYAGAVSSNPCGSSLDMKGNWLYCVDKDLCNEIKKCMNSKEGTLRNLESGGTDTNVGDSLWDMFALYPYIPAVIFASLVVAGLVWLQLLQTCTGVLVWGTLIFNCGFLVVLWCLWFFKYDQNNWMLLVGAGLILLFMILCFKSINRAVKVIRMAAEALKKNPSVFVVNLVVKALLVAYVVLWTVFIIYSSQSLEVRSKDCTLHCKGWVVNSRWWYGILFFPFAYFFAYAKTVVTAAGIGAWYFKDNDPARPGVPALKGLQWAFTTSSGAIMFAAVVVGFTRWLFNQINSKLSLLPWFLSPVACIFKIFSCCIMSCLEMFSKFMLIGQVFCGEAFCSSAKKSFRLISDRLGSAFLTDSVGHSLVTTCAYLFSVGLGLAGWVWIDDAQNYSTISDMAWYALVPVLLIYAMVISYPTITIVIVTWFSEYLHKWICSDGTCSTEAEVNGQRIANAVCGALFIGSVCYTFFEFIGDIVLSAIDVIFFCFAVESDNQVYQSRFESMYILIKSNGEITNGVPMESGGSELKYDVHPPHGKVVGIPATAHAGVTTDIHTTIIPDANQPTAPPASNEFSYV